MGLLRYIFGFLSDTYTDNKGYKRYKDNNKLVHREKAEEKLGRKLKEDEVVHHIDRNKKNNSKGNLWVFKSQDDHDRIHNIDSRRHGKNASYKGFK